MDIGNSIETVQSLRQHRCTIRYCLDNSTGNSVLIGKIL